MTGNLIPHSSTAGARLPNVNALVTEHLELCEYKISGYWDEQDKFYEEITLPRSLSPELVSSSIGLTGKKRWIKLKFALKAERSAAEDSLNDNATKDFGKLTIIYDDNLQFIDENWQINMEIIQVLSN